MAKSQIVAWKIKDEEGAKNSRSRKPASLLQKIINDDMSFLEILGDS